MVQLNLILNLQYRVFFWEDLAKWAHYITLIDLYGLSIVSWQTTVRLFSASGDAFLKWSDLDCRHMSTSPCKPSVWSESAAAFGTNTDRLKDWPDDRGCWNPVRMHNTCNLQAIAEVHAHHSVCYATSIDLNNLATVVGCSSFKKTSTTYKL